MATATASYYSLLTLDLENADDYREGFYAFLEHSGWSKREEADTAWTTILTTPDYSKSDVSMKNIVDSLTSQIGNHFIDYLKRWENNHGELPREMDVRGIMQLGDIGYFSVHFWMNKRDSNAGVKVTSA